MTALRRRRLDDRPLRGLAPRTHPCDVEAVTHRTPHDRRAPDQSSADARRPSCLCLIHDQKVAASPCRMHRSGSRCVDEGTRKRRLQRLDACGRRLPAGPPRQVSDLEAPRRLVRVHQGPGGQDRRVPLAPRVLA